MPVAADEGNGLDQDSFLKVDKITTVPKKRLGYRLGMLEDEDMTRLDRAIVVFLGIAGRIARGPIAKPGGGEVRIR